MGSTEPVPEVVLLTPSDTAGLARVLALYEGAIEPSEQKPVDTVATLLADPRYDFLVSRNADGIDAFAILFFPLGAGFWLLEYLAVDATQRSKGAGARMFEAALAHGEKALSGAVCLLEVDRADAAPRPGNERHRRLKFYARMGAREIAGLRYILPLETAGTPPPMMLLVKSAGDAAVDLPRDEVRRWLTILYRDVYRCAPDDPRIDAMVDPLPERLALVALA